MLEIRLGMEDGSLAGEFGHDVVDTEHVGEAHGREIIVDTAQTCKRRELSS